MRKTTFFTLAFSLLLVLPGMAQLGKVWTEFQFYSVDMQNYLRNNLGETLSPLEVRSQNSLNNSTGDLNIPNPVEAGKSFRQDIFFNPTTDKFENNPVVQSNSVSNEINRLLTRGSVESMMGRDGQRRLKLKLEETEKSIINIVETANNAEDSNQNLLTDLIAKIPGIEDAAQQLSAQTNVGQINLQLQTLKIQTEQSKIIGETLYQTMQTNQSLQYSNLNLANISQQMEEMNRSRRVDSATETARLIRTTSQIDLFGREEN
ncbi:MULTISPECIES: hypothetical protein [Cyanophyceae]|uniref:hypothetical protein n=1 Tax=Cyanophyceae TaxID=3028117 RepID=UPI002331546A|nr:MULTISPECIES: hypothetical protein [Cyanophyceae]MDB9355345.1 hypothetical protein [Nodularia spumigena CS-587/03]MDB9319558.1 hypothetical protein [Nodularia spumigena CS-590/01A]MDB9323248.1 hypothetical protein [Nodularia spumigena CS-591/07A]MDB9326902.1 hypothetical protein [Nodularia spumigena CS-590/02]MDB9329998.1 hypothetical protein [Nodularia spumigena CS-591/04]